MADLSELGISGLDTAGGKVLEEKIKELSGKRLIHTYRDMQDNDPIIGAMLFAIENLIRQVEWRVDAASDDEPDVLAADFLESCFNDMSQPFEDTLSEILTMLPFGFSYHEVVYKMRNGKSEDPTQRSRFSDGRIGWRKMPIRAQETIEDWDFDEDGGIQGMWQQAPPYWKRVYIPIDKSLLFRTTSKKNNPEGKSVLRNAFRPWYFKKHIENIEGIGIERDLAGLPVAWVPPEILSPSATPDQKVVLDAIKDMVVNVRRDEQEGLVLPMAYDEGGKLMYDFKLLSSGGSRQFNTTEVINRYKQEMAMTVLADFILLGHEKVGSFALNSSKTNLFTTALGAWMNSIAAVFNRIAIPRLFELNNLQVRELPILSFGDIETVDLAELGTYITQLAASGVELFPDPKLEAWLKRQASLPVTEEV